MINLSTSDLAGVPNETLRQWLGEAQTAYHELMTGAKGEAFSYTQGDGAKAVTYTRANITQLSAYIQSLKAQLGITQGRRPMRMVFR